MSRLFLLFSHDFTDEQRQDAHQNLGVNEIVELPSELQELWSNIPPDRPDISTVLDPLRIWLQENANLGDFMLIQGDFGACYLMVCFAHDHGITPVYSTNKRMAYEEHQEGGTVKLVHFFHHQIFRVYGS